MARQADAPCDQRQTEETRSCRNARPLAGRASSDTPI